MKIKQRLCGCLALALCTSFAYGQEPCEEKGMVKAGTIEGSAKSVGYIAGVRWGGGTITLNDGKTYNFNVKGLKLLDTGVAATDFKGEIYNLEKIEDVIGVFYGGSTGIKVVKGPGEVVVNNSKCVVIKAKGTGTGVQLSAPGPGGFHLQLAQ